MSDSLWLRGLQPPRLLCPRTFSGKKNTVHDFFRHGLPFPPPGESSWPRDGTPFSCIGRWILFHWAAWEARCLTLENRIFVCQELLEDIGSSLYENMLHKFFLWEKSWMMITFISCIIDYQVKWLNHSFILDAEVSKVFLLFQNYDYPDLEQCIHLTDGLTVPALHCAYF